MEIQDIQAPKSTETLPVTEDNADARAGLKQTAQVKHLVSDGVYIKAYQVPAGIKLVNKQFPTDHITILAKGTVVLEDKDAKVKFVAPAHFNFTANSRYVIYTLEECVWYCVHPTEETDLAKLVETY